MVQGNVFGRKTSSESNVIISEWDGDGVVNKDITVDARAKYVTFHTEPLSSYPIEVDLLNDLWAYFISVGTPLGTTIGSATFSRSGNVIHQSGYALVSEVGKHYVMTQYL